MIMKSLNRTILWSSISTGRILLSVGTEQSSVTSQLEITSQWLAVTTLGNIPPAPARCEHSSVMMTSLISVTLATLIASARPVDIALQDICGNKLVGSCPNKISLKVVGGDSSCAEKVPWNVLVELVTGPKMKAAGEVSDHSIVFSYSLSLYLAL